MTGAAGPLGGVIVLDLCSYLAGPYGCTLLADLGASVIKIEAPQGDMLRQFPSSLAGESRFFLGTNRGKRAIALDLKQPEGLAVLHRMVETADVLVENFRPSVPARLGVDYPRLKAINPRLVYCGLTGYGDRGPLSDKGGFDQVLQCLSGIAVFQGTTAGTPQVVLGSVLDYFTSALLAYGVAAALYHRERSGRGQYLSLSLLRSALTIQAGRFIWAESEGRDVVRDSGAGGLTGIHPTKEGWLYISVHSNQFFARIAFGTRRAQRSRMGSALWRARALRRGALDQRHVRPSAGARRGPRCNPRSSANRAVSRDEGPDQIH